ncbi:MAG: hypothetical protein Q7T86_18720 [Hyphomicrobiaceae bacterium]|jgi:hypothetical protein|nr:hypothetical protein [Hyphomicrobiaceae bacterium]
MGKRIKSLMDAAYAAGYAMAPEDIYAGEVIVEHHVMAPAKSTALVPYHSATPAVSLMAQARAMANRYAAMAWPAPRLPA